MHTAAPAASTVVRTWLQTQRAVGRRRRWWGQRAGKRGKSRGRVAAYPASCLSRNRCGRWNLMDDQHRINGQMAKLGGIIGSYQQGAPAADRSIGYSARETASIERKPVSGFRTLRSAPSVFPILRARLGRTCMGIEGNSVQRVVSSHARHRPADKSQLFSKLDTGYYGILPPPLTKARKSRLNRKRTVLASHPGHGPKSCQ